MSRSHILIKRKSQRTWLAVKCDGFHTDSLWTVISLKQASVVFVVVFLLFCGWSSQECSVRRAPRRVRVGSLSGKRVSSFGRAGPVWHLLPEAEPLLAAESWKEGPGLPGMYASPRATHLGFFFVFFWSPFPFCCRDELQDKLKTKRVRRQTFKQAKLSAVSHLSAFLIISHV